MARCFARPLVKIGLVISWIHFSWNTIIFRYYIMGTCFKHILSMICIDLPYWFICQFILLLFCSLLQDAPLDRIVVGIQKCQPIKYLNLSLAFNGHLKRISYWLVQEYIKCRISNIHLSIPCVFFICVHDLCGNYVTRIISFFLVGLRLLDFEGKKNV